MIELNPVFTGNPARESYVHLLWTWHLLVGFPAKKSFLERVSTSALLLQSLQHPVNYVCTNFMALRLKKKIMQKALVEFYVLGAGGSQIVQILRCQWISDPVGRAMQDEERYSG